jgi:hypothetical protein
VINAVFLDEDGALCSSAERDFYNTWLTGCRRAMVPGITCAHGCGQVAYHGEEKCWDAILMNGHMSVRCPSCSERVRSAAALPHSD